MYLVDTNVISESRKRGRADPGVTAFFRRVSQQNEHLFLSAITIGELRRGVKLARLRAEAIFAERLEDWLAGVIDAFEDRILVLDHEAAQVWGRLGAPDPHPVLDKQIAAIALINDLTLVTRNTSDFQKTGVRLENPFQAP